jgi:hypothetical protein
VNTEADLNLLLERFGEGVRQFLLKANKAQHSAGLFDLRRRTLIGAYAFFDHLPWAFGEIATRTTPAKIGRRGRGLCGEPFGAQINGLLWAVLLARENELALGRDGRDEELAEVVRWWAEMITAYRDSDRLLPHEDDDRQRATNTDVVQRALDAHERESVRPVDVFRVTSELQLYSFVLGGEQRGTMNFHGPYVSTRPGHTLFVEEFTRLRRDELPWSRGAKAQPVDTVCAVFEVKDSRLRFDLFQGMTADPVAWQARVTRAALASCDDATVRPLSREEQDSIVAACQAERPRLFREMLNWDEDFKIAYGAYHYLDFLCPFLDAAELGASARSEARRRFEQTIEQRLDEIKTNPGLVWGTLFTRPHLFTPLGKAYSRG